MIRTITCIGQAGLRQNAGRLFHTRGTENRSALSLSVTVLTEGILKEKDFSDKLSCLAWWIIHDYTF